MSVFAYIWNWITGQTPRNELAEPEAQPAPVPVRSDYYYPPVTPDSVDLRTGRPIRDHIRNGHSICVVVRPERIH